MNASQNRIDTMFARNREAGAKTSVFYVTAGYPDYATTEKVVAALEKAGADLIELGLPFSDPIADGPTIQAASQKALEAGATVGKTLELTRRIRYQTAIPLVLFSAYNPIFHYGLDMFVADAASAGADGVLIPDLPPEEAEELISISRTRDLKTIFLVAPTTDSKRRKLIVEHSSGFTYYISLRGVTGAREELPPDLRANVKAIKKISDLPVVVGFGVSKPSHARLVAEVADGIVVGSALISLIGTHAGKPELEKEVETFARGLIQAMSGS